MPDQTSSASEIRRAGGRLVGGGIAAVALILLIGAGLLLWALPDANAFNAQVERIFIENDDLTTQAEIKLLEILAQSGTAFSETLASYRIVIIVLLVFATAMLIAALVFLIMLISFNRRMAQIERVGIQVNSLLISREENTVYLNTMGFKLTDAYPGRGYFLRGSDSHNHHNLFLLDPGIGKRGFHHLAFEVGTIHELFGGGNNMTRQGWDTMISS